MKNEYKITNILGDTQEYPNLAKISRKKRGFHIKYIFLYLSGALFWRQSVFDPSITRCVIVAAAATDDVIIVVVVISDVVIHL